MSEVKYPGICQHKHGVDQTNMSLDYTNTDVAHDALEAPEIVQNNADDQQQQKSSEPVIKI